MELSAVYALGQFRGVQTAGLMIVSDELTGGRWRNGLRSAAFCTRSDEILTELVKKGLK